jgi:SAM-dependent methyltransferase
VLEIGSGVSPLKRFLPSVLTSDILELNYLDYIFDCHKIDRFTELPDNSVDIITLTNVLHHLQEPVVFLSAAVKKLVPGGSILLVEPFFSVMSYPIYKWLHHEPVEFKISTPELSLINGPLSTSNQAIPYMIFFKKNSWLDELAEKYYIEDIEVGFFTSLSYMLSGGISKKIPIPHCLYKCILEIDIRIARKFPRLFASFFILRLVAK